MQIELLRGFDYAGRFESDANNIIVSNSNVLIEKNEAEGKFVMFDHCVVQIVDDIKPVNLQGRGITFYTHKTDKSLEWENKYLREEVERLKEKLKLLEINK